MSFLPIIRPEKLARIIQKRGFMKVRQSGSHAVFSHSDGRWTTIPMHRKTLGKGLLRKILRDVEVSPEEIKRK